MITSQNVTDPKLLASRGFVYHSESKAGASGHYHANCDCRIVSGFKGMQVQGYDPESLYARYQDCYDTVADEYGHADVKDVLKEMGTRDSAWLNKGTIPKVSFATDSLEFEIRTKRPWEIVSGERLAKHGIRPDFIVDVKRVLNPDTGRYDNIGLPDLADGNEIKTLKSTSSYNTIDSHIKSAAKKGAVRLYFDNSENDALSDETLREYILRSRRFTAATIYVLQKDGTIRKIR